MNADISSPRARALTPYTPGEQPRNRDYIKLNTNENPYPPSPRAAEALRTARYDALRLYPDPLFAGLRKKIADWYSLKPEEVFAGNGSDEILSFAFYAFFNPGNGPVLFPEHTYSFYPVYCTFYELPFRKVPLRPDFSIDLSEYLEIESHAGVIFSNPNAPTGIALERNYIESFLDRYSPERICIIDEAYVDFGAESCAELIRRYPNLLVVHTFSKSRSLAGLRTGFALGKPDLIRTLFAVKDSFNSYPLDRLSQDIAAAVLEDRDYFEQTRQRIITTRRETSRQLNEIGWQVLPSSANFIFACLPGTGGNEIYLRLKEKGILVRHFRHRGIENFIRITIGTDDDMGTFIRTLRALGFSRR